MRINPTEPSSSGDNSNDSLGIVFNEHKLTDSDAALYKSPVPVTPPVTPLRNTSTTSSVKTFETSFLDGGTIITDKRKRRATLGENLNSAFTEWWGNTKQKLEKTLATVEHSMQEDAQEISVVENPEARTETIKKAAAYTVQAPKNDHAIVTKKIATVHHESIPLQTKPIIIKEVSSNKAPHTWASISNHANTATENQSAPEELSLLEISTLKKTKPSYAPPQPETVADRTPNLIPHDSKVAAFFTPTPTTPKTLDAGTTLKDLTQKAPLIPVFTSVSPRAERTENIPPVPLQEEPRWEASSDPVEIPPLAEAPTENTEETPTFTSPAAPEVFAIHVAAIPEEPLEEVVSKPVSHFFESDSKITIPVSHTESDTTTTERFIDEDVTRYEDEQVPTPIPTQEAPVFTVEPPPPVTPTTFPTQTTPETPERYPLPPQPLHGTASHADDEPTPRPLEKLSPTPTFLPTVSQNNFLRRFTRWVIIFGIVLLGVGLAILASTKFNIFEEKATPQVIVAPVFIPTLFKTDSQTEITLNSDKNAFLSELATRVATAPSGVSQFYPVVGIDSARHSATAEEIFAALSTHLGSKTIRSFEDVLILGSITTQKNEPFMVLHSFNFDTLFSGLLAWEPYLVNDMTPFFGTAPTPTSNFTDATLHNKPTRILHDEMGNEILLYSFVNQSTVIITTSRTALALLFEKF